MTLGADTLWTLGLLWLIQAAVVTGLTWVSARRRIGAPGLLLFCSVLLAAFPPFNVLVLAGLAMLPTSAPGIRD